MPLAFGRQLFFREASRGAVIPILAIVAILLLIYFWPRIVSWIEATWRARR
jgi:hypothetical protein